MVNCAIRQKGTGNENGSSTPCPIKPIFSRVQTGTNNPMISAKMRYSQFMNAPTLRGNRRTVVGLDRIPLELRPQPSIIVPLTNF
jgi:hypothetical protein